MVVRIKLQRGRPLARKRGKNRHVALAFGGLLTPAALMAYVLGFWRLASDMGVAGEFGIGGVLSHWQIWILLGALLQAAGHILTRYGRGGEFRIPALLSFHRSPERDRNDQAEAASIARSERDVLEPRSTDPTPGIAHVHQGAHSDS